MLRCVHTKSKLNLWSGEITYKVNDMLQNCVAMDPRHDGMAANWRARDTTSVSIASWHTFKIWSFSESHHQIVNVLPLLVCTHLYRTGKLYVCLAAALTMLMFVLIFTSYNPVSLMNEQKQAC